MNLLYRQFGKQGVVADSPDLRAIEHTSATVGDDLLDVRLRGGALSSIGAVPQLDFNRHSAHGLADEVERLLPLFAKAGLPDAILWPPASD